MNLQSEFDSGVTYTFECETRVSGDVAKEDRVSITVEVDLSGMKVSEVLNTDLAVKFQGAVRKSFDTQEALKKWAEKNDGTYRVHVKQIGHKIESVEQIKAQIMAQISQLPKDEQQAILEKAGLR